MGEDGRISEMSSARSCVVATTGPDSEKEVDRWLKDKTHLAGGTLFPAC